MASILHGSARTMRRVRAERQASKETARILSKRDGLSRTTVINGVRTPERPMRRWDRVSREAGAYTGRDAMIVALYQRTLLRLDDVMQCQRDSIPKLTPSKPPGRLERAQRCPYENETGAAIARRLANRFDAVAACGKFSKVCQRVTRHPLLGG